jgi:hypothetical protein
MSTLIRTAVISSISTSLKEMEISSRRERVIKGPKRMRPSSLQRLNKQTLFFLMQTKTLY